MKSNIQNANQDIENDVQEIASQTHEERIDFHQFAEEVATLDKTFVSIFDDPTKRAEYQNADAGGKLTYYSPELLETLQKIYEGFYRHAQTTHELAQEVYNLGLLTNASYGELSKTLSGAFKRKLSRSYVYKLYMAGKALSAAPALKLISDVEKLAQIGKVPAAILTPAISTGTDIVRIGAVDVVKSSRAQLGEELKSQFPQYCSPKKSSNGDLKSDQAIKKSKATEELAELAVTEDCPLLKLKKAIDLVLIQSLDEELATVLGACLTMVTSRLLEVTNETDHSV